MFKIGEFVVHNGHGLCSITEIQTEKNFYKLETYHNKMSIMMPIDKASSFLRPMLSKDEMNKALNDSVLLTNEYNKDNKERRIYFQQLVTSNDIMDTLQLLKMIYKISEDRKSEKKVLGSFDTQFLQQAEKKLIYEVVVSIGISKDEALNIIYERLK